MAQKKNLTSRLRENVSAFDQYRIRPRILVDVDNVDMSRNLFGVKVGARSCFSKAEQLTKSARCRSVCPPRHFTDSPTQMEN